MYEPFRPEFTVDPYPTTGAARHAPVLLRARGGRLVRVALRGRAGGAARDDVFSSRAMFTMIMNGGPERSAAAHLGRSSGSSRSCCAHAHEPAHFATLAQPDRRGRRAPHEPAQRREPRLHAAPDRGLGEARARDRRSAWRSVAGRAASTSSRRSPIPLPVTIISEMLGVEPERRADFKRWSDAIITNTTGSGRADAVRVASSTRRSWEMINFVYGVARKRRRAPRRRPDQRDRRRAGRRARPLRPGGVPVRAAAAVAGNETTTNLIGNAVHALLDHPEQLERVAADPAWCRPRRGDAALGRADPARVPQRDARRRDRRRAASRRAPSCCVLLGSANRDERRFPDPDRFDIDRDTQGHLSFGFGKHFCLGASLARLEARVALEALVPRLPALALAGRARVVDSFLVRGPKRLELGARQVGLAPPILRARGGSRGSRCARARGSRGASGGVCGRAGSSRRALAGAGRGAVRCTPRASCAVCSSAARRGALVLDVSPRVRARSTCCASGARAATRCLRS